MMTPCPKNAANLCTRAHHLPSHGTSAGNLDCKLGQLRIVTSVHNLPPPPPSVYSFLIAQHCPRAVATSAPHSFEEDSQSQPSPAPTSPLHRARVRTFPSSLIWSVTVTRACYFSTPPHEGCDLTSIYPATRLLTSHPKCPPSARKTGVGRRR
jgi:hypothetical protein